MSLPEFCGTSPELYTECGLPVPFDLQALASLKCGPGVVGNHRHSAQRLEHVRRFERLDGQRLLHARNFKRSFVVVGFDLSVQAPEDALPTHRPCRGMVASMPKTALPVTMSCQVEQRIALFADVAPLRACLESQVFFLGNGQLRRGCGQLAIAQLCVRWPDAQRSAARSSILSQETLHCAAAAPISMARPVAPTWRIRSKLLRTECEPSVSWSPYFGSPIACSIFTLDQSASSSSATTSGRAVRLPQPISDRCATIVTVPSDAIDIHTVGSKAACRLAFAPTEVEEQSARSGRRRPRQALPAKIRGG